jgi:hypothetical protein
LPKTVTIREHVVETQDVEIAARDRIFLHTDVADGDVHRRRIPDRESRSVVRDPELEPRLVVVGTQNDFLREDGVRLSRSVQRRFEKDVGTIGVGEKHFVRTHERVS